MRRWAAGLLLIAGCAGGPVTGSKLHAFGAVFLVHGAAAAPVAIAGAASAATRDSQPIMPPGAAVGIALGSVALIALGVGLLAAGDRQFVSSSSVAASR